LLVGVYLLWKSGKLDHCQGSMSPGNSLIHLINHKNSNIV